MLVPSCSGYSSFNWPFMHNILSYINSKFMPMLSYACFDEVACMWTAVHAGWVSRPAGAMAVSSKAPCCVDASRAGPAHQTRCHPNAEGFLLPGQLSQVLQLLSGHPLGNCLPLKNADYVYCLDLMGHAQAVASICIAANSQVAVARIPGLLHCMSYHGSSCPCMVC